MWYWTVLIIKKMCVIVKYKCLDSVQSVQKMGMMAHYQNMCLVLKVGKQNQTLTAFSFST